MDFCSFASPVPVLILEDGHTVPSQESHEASISRNVNYVGKYLIYDLSIASAKETPCTIFTLHTFSGVRINLKTREHQDFKSKFQKYVSAWAKGAWLPASKACC